MRLGDDDVLPGGCSPTGESYLAAQTSGDNQSGVPSMS